MSDYKWRRGQEGQAPELGTGSRGNGRTSVSSGHQEIDIGGASSGETRVCWAQLLRQTQGHCRESWAAYVSQCDKQQQRRGGSMNSHFIGFPSDG